MKATTRRGAPGDVPDVEEKKKKKKKSAAAARGFMCGCGGSKSVSIITRAANISAVAESTTTPVKNTTAAKKPATAAVKTTVMPGGYRDVGEDDDDADAIAEGSVDALLQQLRELEQGVRALGVRDREEEHDDDAGGGGNAPRRHRRRSTTTTDWGGRRRVDAESVAVVTESADPLGDFRRSMVQMVVENGITGGAELRKLLRRFLSLNSPRHHHLILRAFADVWEELFAGGAPPPLVAAENSYVLHTVHRSSY